MHLLSTSQFCDRSELERLFQVIQKMENPLHYKDISGKIMAIIKDEASTRTRLSFEVAMKRLGGEVVVLDLNTSSAVKGETLEDTIRTVSEYVDVIVLRHSHKGAVERAAAHSRVPVINAGDGDGEHPTQALLDIYTINKELGTIEGLNIMLVGDLKHSRTVHSLLTLLTLYKGIRVQLISPPDLMLRPQDYARLNEAGIEYTASVSLYDQLSLDSPDVIYLTREQKERREYNWMDDPNITGKPYVSYPQLGEEEMKFVKAKAIIMHPLPRCEEMKVVLDADPRCAIWRQTKNGMHVRMALLYNLFNYNSFCPNDK